MDQTGVGKPVLDLLWRSEIDAQVWAVTITAGHKATFDRGTWPVPKPELVGTLQVPLMTRRLKVSPALPETALLVKELTEFQPSNRVAAEDALDWRDRPHDDLILALAIAIWFGERGRVPKVG